MSDTALFQDRQEAGEKLAETIVAYSPTQPAVYALPRGGLPVAVPVAQQLHCPLGVVVAKKITEPKQPELAIGAVTSDGHVLWLEHKPAWMKKAHLSRRVALEQAQQKAQAQFVELMTGWPQPDPAGTTAILIDDGIATGMTMAVAVQALRQHQPVEIWICAPVAPPGLLRSLQELAEQVVILATPEPFLNVGRFYQAFPQVEIEEALACLQRLNS